MAETPALPELVVEGQGGQTIVMVHGWPDTHRVWRAQAQHFSRAYRCVRFTLPGFDPDGPRTALTATGLVETIRAVVDRASPGEPVILMLHDWGCVHGYEFAMRYPHRVARIIGVDIGNPRSLGPALSLKGKLYVFVYQIVLALAWKMGGPAGDWISRRMAKLLGARAQPDRVHSGMGYPYWNTWFGRGNPENKIQHFLPECPTLFIYGRRKPVMFQSPEWLQWLRDKRPENRVIEMDTGHWVMQQRPEEFNAAVGEWLGDSGAVQQQVPGVAAN